MGNKTSIACGDRFCACQAALQSTIRGRFGWMWLVAITLQFCLIGSGTRSAIAGATPANWVIVVNGDSLNSKTIANHYVELRSIPARNVIVLRGLPSKETINHSEFKTLILTPVLAAIEQRGLTPHVQGIAYSCEIPTRITFPGVPKDSSPMAQYLTSVASLNSATYLYQIVQAEGATPISLYNNYYTRLPVIQTLQLPISAEEQASLKDTDSDSEGDSGANAGSTIKDVDEEFLKRYVETHPYQTAAWIRLAELAIEADERTEALDYLERAVENGWQYGKILRDNPAFATIRTESRFQTLLIAAGNMPPDWTEPRGFDARLHYTPNGIESRNPAAGVRYLLSIVLASTSPVGNKLDEAIDCLKLAKEADYTNPSGTFYFTSTSDVRTKCREPLFDLAIEKLKQHGFVGEKISSVLPVRKDDCLGVTMGTPVFAWSTSGSKLLPGAIVDNLTSTGGLMDAPGQTKLTECLKYGAAGSSGAVTEPYSLQQKFPLPFIHETYARGATLAEAFYQSLMGPYQMLIIGDPLCQPWATPPAFTISGVKDGEVVSRLSTIRVASEQKPLTPTENNSFMFLIDGVAKAAGDGSLAARIDPNDKNLLGAYNIRVIAQSTDPMRTRAEKSIWLQFGPESDRLQLTAGEVEEYNDGGSFTVALSRPAATDVKIRHGWEEVATIRKGQTETQVAMVKLGRGPVRLQAVMNREGSSVASLPIVVNLD